MRGVWEGHHLVLGNELRGAEVEALDLLGPGREGRPAQHGGLLGAEVGASGADGIAALAVLNAPPVARERLGAGVESVRSERTSRGKG